MALYSLKAAPLTFVTSISGRVFPLNFTSIVVLRAANFATICTTWGIVIQFIAQILRVIFANKSLISFAECPIYKNDGRLAKSLWQLAKSW